MLLRQLVSSAAQQLLCACITSDMRMHNSWCACVGQLLCANYYPDLWHTLNFFTAHQPSNTRTSAVMHPHIKWCASAQQLMCGLRYYIFQQFLLYLLETSIICLKDFCYTFQVLLLYLSTTIPISFEDYPYIPQRLLLYLPASASVSAFHLFFQHQFSLIYDF